MVAKRKPISKKSESADKLSPLQKLFIDHYFLSGMNATEAVLLAGYKASTRNSAAAIGYRNLQSPNVKAEIERRLAQSAMSANEVLHRLTRQGRVSFADFVEVIGGEIVFDFEKAKELQQLDAIKSLKIKPNKDGLPPSIEVELHDSQAALKELGRYHKLFTDKVVVTSWRDDAIQDIRSGDISYEALKETVGNDLAFQLFQEAGVPIARLVDEG